MLSFSNTEIEKSKISYAIDIMICTFIKVRRWRSHTGLFDFYIWFLLLVKYISSDVCELLTLTFTNTRCLLRNWNIFNSSLVISTLVLHCRDCYLIGRCIVAPVGHDYWCSQSAAYEKVRGDRTSATPRNATNRLGFVNCWWRQRMTSSPSFFIYGIISRYH